MKKFVRIVLAVIAILTAALLIRFAMLGQDSKAGQALGLVSGILAACPDKPNCVCSEYGSDDAHYIAQLDYSGTSPEKAWEDVLQIIKKLGGEVVVDNDGYIAATFSSSLFGFVDDLECRLEPSKKQIQIRSASRVGHSDLGVNRKRVEKIAFLFDRRADEN